MTEPIYSRRSDDKIDKLYDAVSRLSTEIAETRVHITNNAELQKRTNDHLNHLDGKIEGITLLTQAIPGIKADQIVIKKKIDDHELELNKFNTAFKYGWIFMCATAAVISAVIPVVLYILQGVK